ncbi:MAG: hypothetical protein V2B17_05680 [Chloroflexota bacterium]
MIASIRGEHVATAERAASGGDAPTRHFVPLFVTLGAAAVADEAPDFRIDGYWYGLAKRSFAVR